MRLLACSALSLLLAIAGFGAHGAEDYRLLRLDGGLVKWGPSSLGTPASVTYAFIAEPTQFPGARNCPRMVPIDGILAALHIERTRFFREVEVAFATWEAVAGIRFRRIADPSAADIRIGAQATPRGWAFTDVAHAAAQAGEAQRIERALICFNPERRWTLDFGADKSAYQLGYVLMHEAGHAIGLDHSGDRDQVMSFSYPERWRGLQRGDIDGAINLYGTAQTAAPAPSKVSATAAMSVTTASD